MRRHHIQLLAAARAGDIEARCEVGRLYLLGGQGFPQHLPTGIDYLTHACVRDNPRAHRTLAEALPAHELIAADLFATVEHAARTGSVPAQIKAAAWHLTAPDTSAVGMVWLDRARAQGDSTAQQARTAAQGQPTAAASAAAAFHSLAQAGALDPVPVLRLTLARAGDRADLQALVWCLQLADPWLATRPQELAEFVVEAIDLAERQGQPFSALPAATVEAALEHRLAQSDLRATYQLGRALAGLPCADIKATDLVTGGSLRKAAALLLRAADGGVPEAWMHLYRLSSDHRCTVANPQMARFFLEKAAALGNPAAQRMLGTLLLRQSTDLAQSEQAIQWLHGARASGDAVAQSLIASLVLPVSGSDIEAESALGLVRRVNPWLAARLSVSRQFGLTRLEALALNPSLGMRPWGLVVGPHPRVLKAGLAAARAVPALSQSAMASLRAAASMFKRHDASDQVNDGNVPYQARSVRTLFSRHGIDESLFFAHATSNTLNALRRGPRWASSAGPLVRAALQEAA